jgi:hypothetical protein
LNARLYWPRPEALRGAWSMPAVERVDGGAGTAPDVSAPAR